jgi:hypothetical protein
VASDEGGGIRALDTMERNILHRIFSELRDPYHRAPIEMPGVNRRSVEYIGNIIKQGYVHSSSLGVRFREVPAHEYWTEQQEIEKSKRENYFHADRFYPWVFRYERSGLEPGSREVVLTNLPAELDAITSLHSRTCSQIAGYAPAFHHALGFPESTAYDRPGFLRRAYSSSQALRFIAEQYNIEATAPFLSSLFDPLHTFLNLQTAHGQESALWAIKELYSKHEVSEILSTFMTPQDSFNTMEDLYIIRTTKRRAPISRKDLPYQETTTFDPSISLH